MPRFSAVSFCTLTSHLRCSICSFLVLKRLLPQSQALIYKAGHAKSYNDNVTIINGKHKVELFVLLTIINATILFISGKTW